MRPRLLVVTDRYPIDPAHSPAAWMLGHLRALGTVADVEVVSFVRLFPRLKNLVFGGYDRGWFRGLVSLPSVELPAECVVVRHRRCLTVPDRLGWEHTPRLLLRQQREWLSERIRDFAPDAVLVHYVHASAPVAREAARLCGVPLWIDENETLGSMDSEGAGGLRQWILTQLDGADAVITQCRTQSQELRALLPDATLIEIALGIDRASEQRTPQEVWDAADASLLEEEAGEEETDEPLRLLCVTRLDQRTKNVAVLLEALALSREARVQLTVAGDGYLRRELESLAGRLGIAASVTWEGWKTPDELRVLRGRMDAAVQPSAHESFGLAALESAGAGLPLIAVADAGVVPDLAALGAAVIPLEQVTPQQVAEALREFRMRRTELRRQAIEARGRIAEWYSWDVHARQYADALRDLRAAREKTRRGRPVESGRASETKGESDQSVSSV